jgi:hypothetical protein
MIKIQNAVGSAISSGFVAAVAELFSVGQFDTRLLIAEQLCVGLTVGGIEFALCLEDYGVPELLNGLLAAIDEKGGRHVLEICGRLLALQAEGARLCLAPLGIGELRMIVESEFASAEMKALGEHIAGLIDALA